MSGARRLVPLALIVVGGAAILLFLWRSPGTVDHARLAWVATAHQLGPVGYRDPAGAISPDGRWIAYAEGRFLRVAPAGGGAIVELPPAEAQIRNLAWHPDSRAILADGYGTPGGWALYDIGTHSRRALWGDLDSISARIGDATVTAHAADLRQPAWSRDGRTIAAVVNGREGQELWIVAADGSSARAKRMTRRISWPAWIAGSPGRDVTDGTDVACVATIDGHPRLTVPCGGSAIRTDPDLDAYGPLAFTADGAAVYVGVPNPSGMLDLWVAPVRGGHARRLTSFSRDSYAPSVAADGAVVFKVQNYRTVVAVSTVEGGAGLPLAAFQSETPSWDPTSRWLGITYGTWRRVVDDARYPDIAQDAGIIDADAVQPASAPARVVHDSASEDQSLCWSPNGKWIAFHSHRDQSDDIWLRPADRDATAVRISFLGRGAETGWPRWSPDGRWLLFDGASRTTRRSTIHVAGVDQEAGAIVSEPREITVRGVDALPSHAEWLGSSDRIAVVAKEGPGRHVIFTVARDGGDASVLYRFACEHDSPGLAVSPDGGAVVFVAPAPDGFFQLFRLPVIGGTPVQLTLDPTNKTQPAWSPDGRRLAFTIWSYDAQFWLLRQ
jgi:Tol biopolymer transport system component